MELAGAQPVMPSCHTMSVGCNWPPAASCLSWPQDTGLAAGWPFRVKRHSFAMRVVQVCVPRWTTGAAMVPAPAAASRGSAVLSCCRGRALLSLAIFPPFRRDQVPEHRSRRRRVSTTAPATVAAPAPGRAAAGVAARLAGVQRLVDLLDVVAQRRVGRVAGQIDSALVGELLQAIRELLAFAVVQRRAGGAAGRLGFAARAEPPAAAATATATPPAGSPP